jgi:hypothetical protein
MSGESKNRSLNQYQRGWNLIFIIEYHILHFLYIQLYASATLNPYSHRLKIMVHNCWHAPTYTKKTIWKLEISWRAILGWYQPGWTIKWYSYVNHDAEVFLYKVFYALCSKFTSFILRMKEVWSHVSENLSHLVFTNVFNPWIIVTSIYTEFEVYIFCDSM